MIKERLQKFFRNVQFVHIATCDKKSRPNAAPKFLLKVDGQRLYLMDYVLGATWNNLTINPRASISLLNYDTLFGYQFNGLAALLTEGKEYQKLCRQFSEKKFKFSVERVVKSVREEKLRNNFEIIFPDKTGVIIVDISEIVDIGPTGRLTREN